MMIGRAGLLAVAACVLCAVDVHAQSTAGVCEATLGASDWPCIDIAPVPADVRTIYSRLTFIMCRTGVGVFTLSSAALDYW